MSRQNWCTRKRRKRTCKEKRKKAKDVKPQEDYTKERKHIHGFKKKRRKEQKESFSGALISNFKKANASFGGHQVVFLKRK